MNNRLISPIFVDAETRELANDDSVAGSWLFRVDMLNEIARVADNYFADMLGAEDASNEGRRLASTDAASNRESLIGMLSTTYPNLFPMTIAQTAANRDECTVITSRPSTKPKRTCAQPVVDAIALFVADRMTALAGANAEGVIHESDLLVARNELMLACEIATAAWA